MTLPGSELGCAAQHFGLLFVWLTESSFPSQTTLSCCAEAQPEADGENFPVSTKASLPPLAAVAVCWDLRLEHHWCGQLPQVPNQWELNQKTAAWHTKSCPKLCVPMDCRPPSSSVHGVLQARILDWVAISLLRDSSRTRD